MNNIKPKKENEGVGFKYTVTPEQIKRHQELSIEQILRWLYETNRFLNTIQTREEKEHSKKLKNKKNWL